jgi:hypothetical protein
MPEVHHAPELFPHIRIVIGMVIGLGVARLLNGVARVLQDPGQSATDPIHLGWVASMLLLLIHFWWWEFGLYGVAQWTFSKYLFVISYAVLLFLISAFLFPESMANYSGYGHFFFARRAWFFGLLALSFVFDVGDTALKGEAHYARFGLEYEIRTVLLIVACIIAAIWRNRIFHAIFVIALLAHEISWIARLFATQG